MIFLIDNSYTIWIPLIALNKKYFTSSRYNYVLAFDMFIFFLTTISILRAIYIMIKHKKFHANLRIILMFQISQWFEIVLARWFLFPYLIGDISLGDPLTIYKHYWTDKVELMVPITSDMLISNWKLFFGGFLYYHHQASCIFFLLSVSVERAVASYYLSDYEKSTRPYISILIITLSMLFSTGYSLIFALNFFTFAASTFTIFLISGSSVSLYYFVYYYNTRIKILNEKNASKGDYSLARRFQTMENLKSLKMAKWVLTTHAVYVFICQIDLLCIYFLMDTKYWETFAYIEDAIVHYSNLIIVIIILLSVPKWKAVFLKWFCFVRRLTINNKISVTEEIDPDVVARRVAEEHFEHLGKAWS